MGFFDVRLITRNLADYGTQNQGGEYERGRLGSPGGNPICYCYDWSDLPVGFNRVLFFIGVEI